MYIQEGLALTNLIFSITIKRENIPTGLADQERPGEKHKRAFLENGEKIDYSHSPQILLDRI